MLFYEYFNTEEEALDHLITWIRKKISKQKEEAQQILKQCEDFESITDDNELIQKYDVTKDK